MYSCSPRARPHGKRDEDDEAKRTAKRLVSAGKGALYAVFCATAVQFAARLAGIDAVIYDGSFQEWAQKGLPLTTGEAP